MLSRILLALVAVTLAFAAAKKITGSARGENQDLILNVTIYGDPESVKEAVGDDLGGHFIVAEVNVQPKYGKEISIDHDDFVLRTFKNGEKTTPMEPSEIAGRATLVLNGTRETLGEGSEPKRKWSIGGGVGMGGGGMGSGSGSAGRGSTAGATMKEGEKDNPLKKLLEQKILPEGALDKPVTGLLYFPMERQKLKDLELVYGAKETRIEMHFKAPRASR